MIFVLTCICTSTFVVSNKTLRTEDIAEARLIFSIFCAIDTFSYSEPSNVQLEQFILFSRLQLCINFYVVFYATEYLPRNKYNIYYKINILRKIPILT